ncbi:hypothetical protein M2322_000623 [Rhodoblastus acidophilus]|uniref:hypothetical protein n=1 Tax=Rhodoblastus acidophilus TaxID=1074 RepID=UPI00222466AD|nr:hypothetical protein [Rhodoblastus acidophilus]MCW2315103.1 hypothetical protein [Rhodoblastus acidophilus]
MNSLQDNEFTPTARPLRRDAAAEYIREKFGFPCSTQWLAKLAVIGGGPIYVKAGRFPMYQPSDLDAWARSRMSAPKRSTSDAAA